MTNVYEKVPNGIVDLPNYVLSFLGVILDKLEFYGLIESKEKKIDTSTPSTLIIPFVSKDYPYCYGGVELIEKTLKRRGIDCKMEQYSTVDIDKEDGTKTKGYKYKYKLTKIKK